MLNNLTGNIEYRKTRNLSLNISSYQVVESLSDEFVIGIGYKLTEFNKVLRMSLSDEFVIGIGYKLTEFNKVLRMKKSQDFSNDLTVNLDFSYRKMNSLIRKIEDGLSQATSGNIAKTIQFSGNIAKTIQFSAEYGLSRALTIRAFYDLQINEPIVSTASYPTSDSNYGISLRFSLAQ